MADTAGFEELMRRYNQRMFRASRSVLRDDAEAEDAVQDAWVLAWRHLDQVEDPDRIGTWLTRIAIREAQAHARRVSRITPIEGSEERVSTNPRNSPEQTASDRATGRLIERAIDALPEQFRTVFVLRLVEELSVEETADCLDISKETVKTRLHRARKRVADRLILDGRPEVFAFDGARCDRIVAAVLGRIA